MGWHFPHNRLAQRRKSRDYFATPANITEALLREECFDGMTIWECACGGGHLAETLKAHRLSVVSSDIEDRGYGETGVNFLKAWKDVDCIVTNPPFYDDLHLLFAMRANVIAKKKVALLLPMSFLKGRERREYCWSIRRRRFIVSQTTRSRSETDLRTTHDRLNWAGLSGKNRSRQLQSSR